MQKGQAPIFFVFMRNLFLILLTFVSLSSLAQFSTTLNDTLKPFGDGSSNFDCICSDDSFYYALGGVNNSDPQWSNMIIKFDKNFNIINKRKYIDTLWKNASYPYNTIVVNNKQLVICPQVTNKNQFEVYGKIIAINKYNLDTIWTKIIAHPDTGYVNLPNAQVFSDLTSIKETPEGGYILTGNYNLQCSGADKRSFLLKIDSMGNVEWRKTYSSISYLFDIELTPSGGYIVINKYGGTNVTILDSIGNILWKKSANNYIGMATSGALSYTDNNSYVVTTPYMYNTDTSDPLMGINVFKINILNKQIVFDKKYILYHNIECIGLHQDIGIETTSDGSIIVNGTLEKYGVDKSGFILKLNSYGDSLWTKTYNFSTSNISQSQLNDLILTDDGGFLGVGLYSAQVGSVWSAWLFKTDSNGTIGWETTVALNAQDLKIYPNPTADYISIDLNDFSKYKQLNIHITNSELKELDIINIGNGESIKKINLKNYPSGVYFIRLQNGTEILGIEKVVKI